MMKAVPGILVGMLLTACGSAKQDASPPGELPRVAIAGLAIESSTFSPARTDEEAFHPRTGGEVLEVDPFLAPDSADRKRAHWIPTLTGLGCS